MDVTIRKLVHRLRQLAPQVHERLCEPQRQRFNDIQGALFCRDCSDEELLRELRQWIVQMEAL